MEKAVDNLEAMFQKAETDLNYLSRKLSFQLENGQAFSEQDNPVNLLTKIEEIKTEYSDLVQDIKDIQDAQKEAVSFFQSALVQMAQLLQQLESHSESPEIAEDTKFQFEELAHLFGIPVQNILPTNHTEEQQPEFAPSGSVTAADILEPCPAVGKKPKKIESVPPAKSTSERRTENSEYADVTKEEFMSVSELIRGKVKLEDVNRTYKMLWQHFKEEGNKQPLTPQEMNSMGLRVTGATGSAKLKVLRALKLCQISKSGDVILL